ncbi:MAG TPA: cyclic pyranopterin monophosphate synthase MoaC [Blastocatellia bacterium]|nr:cyclic pyranopterin monophosphate synthase MoaC [Blastocatellia bacterium]
MTLTHVDSEGRSRMVDVSGKPITRRTAVATGLVRMSPSTAEAIRDHRTPKGDPLEISRIAGVMGAKRTSELIPLCHPLPLNQANVEVELLPEGVLITATATTEGKTGVEMEALTAVSIAALTIYDMCKAIDKSMVISEIKLESKTGGTSGDFRREQAGEVG